MRWLPVCLLAAACQGCGPRETAETDTDPAREPVEVRVASFNTSLFQDEAGRLAIRLRNPDWTPGQQVARVLQEVRPDIVLLNEVDTDLSGETADRLRQNFLAVGQGDGEPLDYPHVYVAGSNTGVHSGFDLDNDGTVDDSPGDQGYGGDAFGFGTFEGQYGMLLLSRFPIAGARTFQELKWADLPEPGWPDDPSTDAPDDWYSPEEKAVMRLSSKSHWDVAVQVAPDRVLHILASHPTPPAFDGPEDRNGRRNDAEIRFWVDYIASGAEGWMTDDEGTQGGLGDAPFVIVGDLNADPNDGDTAGGAINDLLDHPRVSEAPPPASAGGTAAAAEQGGVNAEHTGDPAHDTADFSDGRVGNLRVDYALPSADLEVRDSGVFWPAAGEPGAEAIEVSDHRAVWVQVAVP
jgi:endonuclease/exonuclease/phosphatase family metal-dependent hydrolase